MVGLYRQQSMASTVNVLVSGLDTAAGPVDRLVACWLDNSEPALERAFQAGTVLQEQCAVGNKAEVVSRVDTGVEEVALALVLSVLVGQAGWKAPVG